MGVKFLGFFNTRNFIRIYLGLLLIIIAVSLLNKAKLLGLFLLGLWKEKKINNERKIKENRKIKINNPLSGSFAKVCTELRIPDLTKNVPLILRANVDIDKIITQAVFLC